MFKQIAKIVAVVAAAAFMVGCAAPGGMKGGTVLTTNQNTSSAYRQAQQPQNVEEGVVVMVRDIVMIDQPASMGQKLGASLGGVAGLLTGKAFSKNHAVQAGLAGLGGMLGAEYGKQATGNVKGQEIIIELPAVKTGWEQRPARKIAIAQSSADGVVFRKGQRVIVIGGGRVAPM